MTVLSIQKHTLVLGAGINDVSANLTGTPATSTASCVPFAMTRVGVVAPTNDQLGNYMARVHFVAGSPNTVQATRVSRDVNPTITVEVTVVEFDSSKVNVYSGPSTIPIGTSFTVSNAFGAGPVTVNLAKAFLYFTYATDTSAATWFAHTMSGEIATNSSLQFELGTSQTPDRIVDWWVVECKNTEWAVQPFTINLGTAQTTNSYTLSPSVDPLKSFILGSHEGSAGTDSDSNAQNTFSIAFNVDTGTATSVNMTRVTAAGDNIYKGFVVTFTGDESVQRGTLTQSTSVATQDVTLGTSVTESECWVHATGQLGTMCAGSFPGVDSQNPPDAFCTWTFVGTGDTSTIRVTHSVNGAEASNILPWEVVDWFGAAPPATRRVMVIT